MQKLEFSAVAASAWRLKNKISLSDGNDVTTSNPAHRQTHRTDMLIRKTSFIFLPHAILLCSAIYHSSSFSPPFAPPPKHKLNSLSQITISF